MIWLWIPLVAAALLAGRIAVTRVVVPRWRAGGLSDATAAWLIVTSRALTLILIAMAVVSIVRAPVAPGIVSAVMVGVVYALVARGSIARMLQRHRLSAGAEDEADP
jgi:hypothetical protein